MKTKILVALFFISMVAQAQLLFKLSKDSLTAFSYSGGDEFNSNRLDLNYWNNGLGWTRVLMSQDLAFSPEHVTLEKGVLLLIAEKKDSIYTLQPHEIDSSYLKKEKISLIKNQFLTKYSVGCIISKQKLHYGLYEIKFKVQEGKGIWPAFWFYGGKKNEEIDVFELKGERNNELHVDTHCPSGCDHGYNDKFSFSKNWGAWLPVSGYLHNDFNLMHLDWSADHITWYMNGYPFAYFKGNFSNPMNLYLNTSVAKNGGAFDPGPDTSTKWPNIYEVDYLRIWQKIKNTQILYLKAADTLISFHQNSQLKPKKKKGLTYKKTEFEAEDGMLLITFSESNRINIELYGKLKGEGAKVSLIGKQVGTISPNLNDPQSYNIPLQEAEITLSISFKNKIFKKQISLIR